MPFRVVKNKTKKKCTIEMIAVHLLAFTLTSVRIYTHFTCHAAARNLNLYFEERNKKKQTRRMVISFKRATIERRLVNALHMHEMYRCIEPM